MADVDPWLAGVNPFADVEDAVSEHENAILDDPKGEEDERQKAIAQFVGRRMRAYRRFWQGRASSEDIKIVMEDLGKFCRADSSTFDPDARIAANLDGRREVWLRIKDFTQLSVEELVAKYDRGSNR